MYLKNVGIPVENLNMSDIFKRYDFSLKQAVVDKVVITACYIIIIMRAHACYLNFVEFMSSR